MKYQLIIYFVFAIFFLCNSSCSNSKNSIERTILNHEKINLSEEFVGYGGFLEYYKNKIFGVEIAPSLPPFFCLIKNEEKHSLFRFGNRGQGPNDFNHPYSVQYVDDETVGVMDLSTRTYCEFVIPEENYDININKKIKFDYLTTRIIKTAYNEYIGLSMQDELFIMTDSIGENLKCFFEYPHRSAKEQTLENKYRAYAYNGNLSTNPSKTKFVYTSYNGEIIHFYNIEHNNIKPIIKIENVYPIYQNRNDNMTGVIIGTDCVLGYISSYATEQFVYTLFSGEKHKDIERDYSYSASILRVFNWKGNLIKEYELDVPCSYICVSNDNTTLWAIAAKPDYSLVSFDLRENKHNDYQSKEKEKLDKNNSIISSENTDDTNQKNQSKVFVNKSTVQTQDIGKLRIGEEKLITIQLKGVSKITSSSEDIIIKDSIISSDQHLVSFFLKKQKTGFFNDTVFISLASSFTLPLAFSGEIVE